MNCLGVSDYLAKNGAVCPHCKKKMEDDLKYVPNKSLREQIQNFNERNRDFQLPPTTSTGEKLEKMMSIPAPPEDPRASVDLRPTNKISDTYNSDGQQPNSNPNSNAFPPQPPSHIPATSTTNPGLGSPSQQASIQPLQMPNNQAGPGAAPHLAKPGEAYPPNRPLPHPGMIGHPMGNILLQE